MAHQRQLQPVIIDQIRERMQNGFHPFTLQLSNGRSFLVPHRDLIAVHPKAIVVINTDGISHTINPLHIVSVDEGPQQ
jgi:hypothetical protein